MVTSINTNILECLKRMRLYRVDTGMPFYAEFCLSLNFIQDDKMKTCAVNVTSRGLNFYYNDEFVNSLSEGELSFVIVHEVLHLLSKHNARAKGLNHKISNIVMDMIINYNIIKMVNDHRAKILKRKDIETVPCFSVDGFDVEFNLAIPRFKDTPENVEKDLVGKNTIYIIPDEYDGNHIYEPLYAWYLEKSREKFNSEILDKYKNKSGKSNDDSDDNSSQGGGSGENGETPLDKWMKSKSNYGKYGKDGYETFDDYLNEGIAEALSDYVGEHKENEVDSSYADSLVSDVFKRCKLKGLVTSDIDSIISNINKSKEDILSKVIKEFNDSITGSMFTDKTYTRPNRREIEGVKGKRKFNSKINVILDISGSMYGLLEIVLSYIFKRDVEVNLVLCDVEVKDHIIIKNTKELNGLKVKGFGGTIMQVGVNYVVENLNKYDTFLLTDGLTDSLDISNLKHKFVVITTEKEVDIINSNNKVKQFIVNEDDF